LRLELVRRRRAKVKKSEAAWIANYPTWQGGQGRVIRTSIVDKPLITPMQAWFEQPASQGFRLRQVDSEEHGPRKLEKTRLAGTQAND
jgi:hypothetical protein